MRVLLVVNAAASSVTPRRRRGVERALGAHHDLEVVATMRRGHAMFLARAGARRGVDCVAVLGGDGTLNEVVTALAGSTCSIAPLPGGSTNVFARTIGLPDDPVKAAAITADTLIRVADGIDTPDPSVSVRCRWVETTDRPCRWTPATSSCTPAWDGTPTSSPTSSATDGSSASSATVCSCGPVCGPTSTTYDRSAPHFSVAFDDGEVVEDGYFTLVLNSDPYTYVGHRPLRVSPAATLDRPLSVLTLRSLGSGVLIQALRQALGDDAGVVSTRDVHIRTDVTGLTIRRHDSATMDFQVDGDHLGSADRLRFDHRPDGPSAGGSAVRRIRHLTPDPGR